MTAAPISDLGGADPYELLGVPREATEEEIVASHRARIRLVHPDRGGSNEPATLLNVARDILLNPSWRAEYDKSVAPVSVPDVVYSTTTSAAPPESPQPEPTSPEPAPQATTSQATEATPQGTEAGPQSAAAQGTRGRFQATAAQGRKGKPRAADSEPPPTPRFATQPPPAPRYATDPDPASPQAPFGTPRTGAKPRTPWSPYGRTGRTAWPRGRKASPRQPAAASAPPKQETPPTARQGPPSTHEENRATHEENRATQPAGAAPAPQWLTLVPVVMALLLILGLLYYGAIAVGEDMKLSGRLREGTSPRPCSPVRVVTEEGASAPASPADCPERRRAVAAG